MTNNTHKPYERRFKRRFPLRRELRYAILTKGNTEPAGTGLTSDVSSGSIGFTADRPLMVGTAMEIVMSWPVALENGCPLELVARGRAIRSNGTWVVCVIGKFEFRAVAQPEVAELVLAAGGFGG
jgi:hypothetical protein